MEKVCGEPSMKQPMFSIIVVALNAGNKLLKTAESIRQQVFGDYEVIVKDGNSKDGSIEKLRGAVEGYPEDIRTRFGIYSEPDSSIYDGMNQAAGKARGRYFYFLNCGDFFCDSRVLERAARYIGKAEQERKQALLFYGDIFDALRGNVVASNPKINGFACYRNVPCHQACIYSSRLFEKRGYEPKYRVRADYEHFLWSFYREKALPMYIPVVLASYEGGGFSEARENIKKSAAEHREITGMYMTGPARFSYRMILLLTLAPLRTRMAQSPQMAGFYQKCKKLLYNKGRN